MSAPSDREILDAVAAHEGEIVGLLVQLVGAPTTLGNEEPGQTVMEEALRDLLDLEPSDIPLDADALRADPSAAPFDWEVTGKRTEGEGCGLPFPAEVDQRQREECLDSIVQPVSAVLLFGGQ